LRLGRVAWEGEWFGCSSVADASNGDDDSEAKEKVDQAFHGGVGLLLPENRAAVTSGIVRPPKVMVGRDSVEP